MVAATELAWRWIDRLGMPGPNRAEPLPPPVYVLATHVAASPERRPARARVRAGGRADGTWVVVRAAPLTTGSQAAAGYAVTLEAASADDLAPLLMRAWRLTRREREVARLVIDGLPTEDIASALFISVHTVRDHLKMIFGKMASAAARSWSLPSPGEHPPRPMSPRNRNEAPSPATALPSSGTRPGQAARDGSGDTDALGGAGYPGSTRQRSGGVMSG